jgi:tRNA(adenine34) deaminase
MEREFMSFEQSGWEGLSPLWQACLEEAWAAFCAGSLPIGSVVAGPDGSILARGRNRILESHGETGLLFGHTLAHAEMNALAVLPNHGMINRTECILYSTMEPCPMCMGAVYMSAVRTIHFAARDAWAGSTNLLKTTPYLSHKPVRAFGPQAGVLEDVLVALMVGFDLKKGREAWNPVFTAWQKDSPRGVQYGRALYETRGLEELRQAGTPAPDVFNYLLNGLLEHSIL